MSSCSLCLTLNSSMKVQKMEFPFVTNHKLKSTPKIVLLILVSLTLLIFTALNTSSKSTSSLDKIDDHKTISKDDKYCDIFTGEWVPNPEGPYYTNETCWAIHEHQNCMKYGRPDTEFMKWKWKPDECELQVFNPFQFLDIVRGKSMAFIGDSVGRNHMQSLICLLSRVEYPIDNSDEEDHENFIRWKYPSYNFTIATFWSPFLVKTIQAEVDGPTHTGLFNLYLDEPDEIWTTQIEDFDYLIIAGGNWYYRPSMYYEKGHLVGCRFCQKDNVTDLPMFYGYRRALKTALKAINKLENFKGIAFLRTFAPSHFEGGIWNEGGNCLRKKPFTSKETRLEGESLELYLTQVEEFRIAKREGKRRGKGFRMLDTTQAMLLRPDGHPSRYGHWANENVTLYNDCVHWCLPGPIDAWSDLLLEMLKREGGITPKNVRSINS